jgi:hypothetical protein
MKLLVLNKIIVLMKQIKVINVCLALLDCQIHSYVEIVGGFLLHIIIITLKVEGQVLC